MIRPARATIVPNAPKSSLAEIRCLYGEAPWAHVAVLDSRIRANVICKEPGPKPRGHWHPTCDEWWVILDGEVECDIEELGVYRARAGDVVCAPKGHVHRLTTIGDGPSIRLSVGAVDRSHNEPDTHSPAERRRRIGQSLTSLGEVEPDTPAWLPPNLPHVYIQDIKAARESAPWSHALIANEHARGTLVYQSPTPMSTGEMHPGSDEWWVVLEGEAEWWIDGLGTIIARKHDFVCIPAGRVHMSRTIGTRPSMRLAVQSLGAALGSR